MQNGEPILLCYACLAWLVRVCYALDDFTLWRLAASAHNVLLCQVRRHKGKCVASNRKGFRKRKRRHQGVRGDLTEVGVAEGKSCQIKCVVREEQ